MAQWLSQSGQVIPEEMIVLGAAVHGIPRALVARPGLQQPHTPAPTDPGSIARTPKEKSLSVRRNDYHAAFNVLLVLKRRDERPFYEQLRQPVRIGSKEVRGVN